MDALRLSKILLVLAVALTCTRVVIGNVVDPAINLDMVQHVPSMDTVPPDSGITGRAITNPSLQWAAFVSIIAVEALTALLLWLGSSLKLRRLTAPAEHFLSATIWAIQA